MARGAQLSFLRAAAACAPSGGRIGCVFVKSTRRGDTTTRPVVVVAPPCAAAVRGRGLPAHFGFVHRVGAGGDMQIAKDCRVVRAPVRAFLFLVWLLCCLRPRTHMTTTRLCSHVASDCGTYS